jgi:hypothetical protein
MLPAMPNLKDLLKNVASTEEGRKLKTKASFVNTFVGHVYGHVAIHERRRPVSKECVMYEVPHEN